LRISPASDKAFVLLTGATGFIGHNVLAELFRRGRRCAVLLRPPFDESLARLQPLLEDLDLDVKDALLREQLIGLEGDLAAGCLPRHRHPVAAIIHAAAVTRFQPDATGEPHRTNVAGTQRLLEWAASAGVRDFHLVSSAYSCGLCRGPVPEAFNPEPPDFHNAYEQTKRDAERACLEWSSAGRRTVTIHRPSVVVGEWNSGRATRFSGFYLSARATEFLDRSFPDHADARRLAVPLRIKGRPHECQNIVPVDYVAGMIASIVCRPERHGQIYHLAHPNPPTNQLIKTAFEQHFQIAGGRFVAPEHFDDTDLNDYEQQFYNISRPIEHYFLDTPVFLQENAAQVARRENTPCPTYDTAAIGRLISYAQTAQWGRARRPRRKAPACALYFESFLPAHISRSRVAQMTALSVTMRFIIEDELHGEWVCQFERGMLETVHRGPNGFHEHFGYRTTRDVFWEAISGRVHPQELFLTGRAEVYGDVEKALKMAMILHAFTREFPCDPARLAQHERESCSKK
jgi:nucleoside-diphosphate-sugar epimerase